MKKHIRKLLSILLCTALLASVMSVQPIFAAEASEQSKNASSTVSQPEKYTLPVTHEDGMQPVNGFDRVNILEDATNYEHSMSATLTTDEDKVLSGKVSAKISVESVNNGTSNGIFYSFRTNTFAVAGIEGLATDKIKTAASDDYAYFKIRIKVPANETGSAYNFWPIIKQGGNYFFLGYKGISYDADGTKVNTVKFNTDETVSIPSGFDGYLYMPVYRMRNASSNKYTVTSNYTGAYGDNPLANLDEDFEMFFYFLHNEYNLDNVEILFDDIGFVLSGDYEEEMPYNFDEITYPLPIAKGYNSKWYTVKNVSYTGGNALNGSSSMLVDIQDVRSTNDDGTYNYYSYNYADFGEQNGVADENVGGIMVRIKLLNDTTTGEKAHAMYLALEQSGRASTCVGGKNIKLFDANGNLIPTTDYTVDSRNLYLPSGFDGFVFFPLNTTYWRNESDKTNGKALADITNNFTLRLWFVTPKNWAGIDAVIDDVSLYNIADSTAGITELDALKAMQSLGYDVELPTPEFYDVAFDFEDGISPFDTMSSIYNGTPTVILPTDAELVTGEEALSGNTSLKFTAVRSEESEAEGRVYQRAESSYSTFEGIDGLDVNSIAENAENYAYITMRIKVPDTAEKGYKFNVYARQDGKGANETRLRAAYGYTVDGEYVEFAKSDGVSTIPAGFNGIIYMPFKLATSETTIGYKTRAMYGNSYTNEEDGTVKYGNDYMVDFSREFELRFYLSDTAWADTVLYVDDIQIKHYKKIASGSDVCWFFDERTGTLSIMGEGAIPDYTESAAPWAYCNYAVKEINIGLGVTAIGAEAFKNLTEVEKASMRTTVTSIGSKAFAGCTALTEIDIPKTVETIAEDAFDKTILISCYEGSYAEEFADLSGYETEHPKTLKVFAIGNSFTMNAFKYIAEITRAVGVEDYTLGRMYYGGRTLQEHYEHTRSAPGAHDTDDYEYYEYSNEKPEWACEVNKSMTYGLEANDWDIIIIQGSSADSLNGYNNNGELDGIIEYINTNKTNPYAELGWYGTWSIWDSYIAEEGDRVENSYKYYKTIMRNVEENVTPIEELKYFIPVGTALQTLRNTYMTDYETNNKGDKYYDFMVDDRHLNSQGCYIAGLTWVRTLTGISIDELTYNPVFSEADFALVKTSVNAAMENPYDISVAMLNGKYYSALSDAVKEAEAGNTVTLMGNSKETVAYDKDITIIGGVHTVSGVVYSDYNGDTKTDLLDLIRIKRYLADPENIAVENGKGDITNTADNASMTLLKKVLLGTATIFTD